MRVCYAILCAFYAPLLCQRASEQPAFRSTMQLNLSESALRADGELGAV